MTRMILATMLFTLSGCGISSIHCEIVSDEELMREVLSEVINEKQEQD